MANIANALGGLANPAAGVGGYQYQGGGQVLLNAGAQLQQQAAMLNAQRRANAIRPNAAQAAFAANQQVVQDEQAKRLLTGFLAGAQGQMANRNMPAYNKHE